MLPPPLQESVTLTVTSKVQRGGSYKGGYQIINQSLVATVWVSSNPGMVSGTGTPVSPGTALIWTTSDDLYLILGNDTQSVAAGSSTVTLSYQTQDWSPNPAAVAAAALNTGMIIIEKQVIIFSSNLTTTSYIEAPKVDITQVNSIMVVATPNLVAPSGILQFRWYDINNHILDFDQFTWMQNGNGSSYFQIPCRGSNLVISWDSPGAALNRIDLVVIGSQRNTGQIRTSQANGQISSPCLFKSASFTIPATSVSSQQLIPPWYGPVTIDVTLASAALPGASSGVMLFSNGDLTNPMQIAPFNIGPVNGICSARLTYDGMGNQAFVSLFNGTGALMTIYSIVVNGEPRA